MTLARIWLLLASLAMAVAVPVPGAKAAPPPPRWAEAGASVMYANRADTTHFERAFVEAMNRWLSPGQRFAFDNWGGGAKICGPVKPRPAAVAYIDKTKCGSAFNSTTLAVTLLQWNSAQYLIRGEIIFNGNFSWDTYSGPWLSKPTRRPDFTRVAVHELGHLAGLGHNASRDSIMFEFATNVIEPNLEDIGALATLYHGAPLYPARGGLVCAPGSTTSNFTHVGLGPLQKNVAILGKCLDGEHFDVTYVFSLPRQTQIAIRLGGTRTEVNMEIVDATISDPAKAVIFKDANNRGSDRVFARTLSAGVYRVHLWREVGGGSYELVFEFPVVPQ